MLVAVLSALVLQQSAPQTPPGQIVWNETPADTLAPPAAPPPPIPEWARTDPFGYERSECSPMVRAASETLEGCQARVRFALAANLGDTLPVGLAGGDGAEDCRQEAAGDRYALQCGPTRRNSTLTPPMTAQRCERRPQRQGGAVVWQEECEPADGSRTEEGGLRLKLWGDDD